MSTSLSHASYEIRPWPPRAVEPTILYLHIGDQVPAAAANTAAGWQVVTFGAHEADPILDDEEAARAWLTAFATGVAA